MNVSEALSSVVGESIVTMAERRDLIVIVEAGTDSVNGDRMAINLLSNLCDVQWSVFSKRFEYLALSLVFAHLTLQRGNRALKERTPSCGMSE